MAAWLLAGKVSRLVLALLSAETRETLERWQFDINLEDQDSPASEDKENQGGDIAMADAGDDGADPLDKGKAREGRRKPVKGPKTEKEIQTEIQGIIRQITASVTFLPVLTEKCMIAALSHERQLTV